MINGAVRRVLNGKIRSGRRRADDYIADSAVSGIRNVRYADVLADVKADGRDDGCRR